MNDAPTAIYGLLDPRTGTVCYIGKTVNPKARMLFHRSDAKSSGLYDPGNRRVAWMKELAALGLQPRLIILAETRASQSHAAEQRAVMEYLHAGAPLLNCLHPLGLGPAPSYVADAIRKAKQRQMQDPRYRKGNWGKILAHSREVLAAWEREHGGTKA